MVLPTINLAHWYPHLRGRLGSAGTQAHTAFKPKATGEFQKHGSWPLPSLRAHITGRSESLNQSTLLQPCRHRQPAGPETPKTCSNQLPCSKLLGNLLDNIPRGSERCSSCCSPTPDRRTIPGSEKSSHGSPSILCLCCQSLLNI